MENEDFEIEDLISNFDKKKVKKNTSKSKGNRGERLLANVLEARFEGRKFFRVVGSGNRWSHVDLSEEAKGVFTGDIVCPHDFKFVVECKYGYETIEMCGIFTEGQKQFNEWLEKAERDASSLGKSALLCWKKPHYEWLAFVKFQEFAMFPEPSIHMNYNNWVITSLSKLLKLNDKFWFTAPSSSKSSQD